MVTDVSMRPGHTLLALLLVLPAERAGQKLSSPGPTATPVPASAGRVNDLMNALMTQAELLGDLAQRPSGQLESAYRSVEFRSGGFGAALSIEYTSLRGSRLTQQPRVDPHVSTVATQDSASPRTPCRPGCVTNTPV